MCSSTQHGFTLLELIVVILLLSILLGFAVPAFRDNSVTTSKDSAARELLQIIRKLKIAALNHQSIHRLHLSLSENRIWITREDKPGEQTTSRRVPERTLSNAIRIDYVRYPGDRVVRSGEAVIAFYPQGYSDRAVIRLTDGGRTPIDLVVEAFLPMALIASNESATDF
jgi:prepilin-type N-terminal cleavage/methylation domain-containing protein